MKINVPPQSRDHFWEEPSIPDYCEFWSFRWRPPCREGDDLIFLFDGIPVARAVCCYIERPGQSRCERTGKYGGGWKVFWLPETFVDLRNSSIPIEEGGSSRSGTRTVTMGKQSLVTDKPWIDSPATLL